MSNAAAPARAGSVADLEQFWVRTKVGWHAVYLGLLLLVAALVVTREGQSADAKLASLALLAVMAATYLTVGRRLLGEDVGGVATLAHVALTWACFGGLLIVTGGFDSVYFLLFALFPQIWAFFPTRWAVIATFAFVVGLSLVEVGMAGWERGAALDVLPQMLLQLGLSLLLGLFISGAFQQAERRAMLIDELHQTRAELAATEHARGVLAERERLAHEIHDTLAQSFTSILTLTQATDTALARDADAARERLGLIERAARDGLAEARALVGALGPVDLQAGSLAQAVERVVTRFGEETGLPAEVTVSGRPRALPANAEVVLLRATQEALANVRKHAAARAVRVVLAFSPDGPGSASLEVVDDGRGFEPLDVSGFGLQGMRARVEQVGGTLEVASGPGLGTRVAISLP
ncbi:MAG: sensor histidine kinase [Jiangellaceae bacterium]